MNDWAMGTVVSAANGSATVRLDSDLSPLQKPCRLPRGCAPLPGDRALLLQYGGVFIVAAVYAGAG